MRIPKVEKEEWTIINGTIDHQIETTTEYTKANRKYTISTQGKCSLRKPYVNQTKLRTSKIINKRVLNYPQTRNKEEDKP